MARRIFISALILLVSACGPKTIVSSLFPLKYAVVTEMTFDDDGAVSRQAVVSACSIVDQTDSIAANFNTTVTGERHWLRRADGSLWVFGLMGVCRWHEKPPPGAYQDVGPPPPKGADAAGAPQVRLSRSLTYRYDDPVSPERVDAYWTHALFAGRVDGLTVSARMAGAEGAPTDTLRATFPYLSAAPGEGRDAELRGRFFGVSAEAEALTEAKCPAPNPSAASPIILERSEPCVHGRRREAGGLVPDVDLERGTVRFSLSDRREGFAARFFPASLLARKNAGGAWADNGFAADWWPTVCLDGVCAPEDAGGYAVFYYPAANMLVTVRPAQHQAFAKLFLAERAPVWSGTD